MAQSLGYNTHISIFQSEASLQDMVRWKEPTDPNESLGKKRKVFRETISPSPLQV